MRLHLVSCRGHVILSLVGTKLIPDGRMSQRVKLHKLKVLHLKFHAAYLAQLVMSVTERWLHLKLGLCQLLSRIYMVIRRRVVMGIRDILEIFRHYASSLRLRSLLETFLVLVHYV